MTAQFAQLLAATAFAAILARIALAYAPRPKLGTVPARKRV